MTLTVDDDFGGFVAARWPDLEAVALVGVGDPELARELTTAALAGLGARWQEAVEDGAPTRAARSALMRSIAGPRRGGRSRHTPAEPGHLGPPVGADDTAVEEALLAAIRDEPPLVRAGLAAAVLWDCDDAETAALAGVPPGPLTAELDAARTRLLAAHREALAAEGLSPADWRMERDLADAVDILVATRPDPPDPAGLVTVRAGRLRRRTLLAGGAALLVGGASAWWLLRDATDPATGAGSPTVATDVRDDDAVWALATRWPPRGSLNADADIRARVTREGGAGARLLFAEDVDGVRVAVAALPGSTDPDETLLLGVWSGPVGIPADGLRRVPLERSSIDGATDAVAVTVPWPEPVGSPVTRTVVAGARRAAAPASAQGSSSAGGVLVLLARPDVRSATWSPVVHPTANGSVERTWTLVRLREGVGTRLVADPGGTAARVQLGDYDGPPAGPGPAPLSTAVDDPTAAATRVVASATGVSARRLRSDVVVDSPVDGAVLGAFGMASAGGDGRVRVVHTSTPDGGLVRTLHVTDDRGRTALVESPRVFAAEDADAPVVSRLDRIPPRTTRYLVVAPGADRCQLLATAPAGYPVSNVQPMREDVAVLPIINGQDTNSYRLVLRAADGTRLYDEEPPRGRRLLDL